MSDIPDLSIVLINWNGKDLLIDCIPSIFSSTHKATLQVILVDNGSEDGSADWCRVTHPNVEVLALEKNLGFTGGNNEGLKVATGRYVMLLNNDTIVQDNAFDILVDYMDKHSEVGGCGPKLLNVDKTLQRNVRCFPSLWTEFCQEFCLSALLPNSHIFAKYYMGYWPHNETKKVDFVIGAALLMRKDIVDDIGMLDNESFFIFYEETDWCLRLKKAGHHFVYVNDSQIVHLGGASYVHRKKQFHYHMLNSRYNYHRKHFGKTAVACLWLIHLSSALLFTFICGFLAAFAVKEKATRALYRRYVDTLSYHLDRVLGKNKQL